MADYLGDFVTGETVVLWWNTNAIAGESITRATDGSIRIYKDNSDTQRASSAGITDTEDADTLTGAHRLVIDLSDNTDSGFYAAGSDYAVVLVAATIDGKTINHALGQFSIENRAMNTAAAVRAALGMSSANLDTQLSTIDSNVDSILVDTGTTLQAELDGIQADTEDIQTRLPAALVSGRMDSSVGAMAANTLTASALASDAVTEMQSGLATASAVADVPTVAEFEARTIPSADYFVVTDYTAPDNTGIGDIETKVDALDLVADAIKVTTDKLDDTLEDDAGTFRFTTNALEQAPTGGSAPSAATIRAEIDANSTQLAAILADTSVIGAAGAGLTAVPYNAAWDAEIQSEVTDALNAYDPPTKTELDSGLAALNDLSAAEMRTALGLGSANLDTQLADLPTNAELATALASADDAVLARLGTPAGASIAADIAAIEAQTDDIGTNGAGLTAVPWNAAWDAEVQSEVADALGVYDPPTNAEMVARTILAADYFVTGDYTAPDNAGITAIKAVTDLFTFTSGAVDANVERINGDATAAANLAISAATMVSGNAQAGTLSSTQMSTNLSSSTNDYYTGRTVIFTSGALQYQAAAVEAYNGATKVITFSQRTGAPQAGDGFILV